MTTETTDDTHALGAQNGVGEQRPRIWGGTTLADRRAVRREKLLEVGLDLLGAPAPASLSVRAVCRNAQLTERYFYESFHDRDTLVVTLYENLAAEVRDLLEQAQRTSTDPLEVARESIEQMVRLIVDDPRKGRVLLVAPLTESSLAEPSQRLMPVIAQLIRDQLPASTPRQDADLVAVAQVGALMALFYVYLQGQLPVDRARFVDQCVAQLDTARHLVDCPAD